MGRDLGGRKSGRPCGPKWLLQAAFQRWPNAIVRRRRLARLRRARDGLLADQGNGDTVIDAAGTLGSTQSSVFAILYHKYYAELSWRRWRIKVVERTNQPT